MADLSLYQRMPGFDAYRQEGIDRNLQRDLIKAQTERQKQAALTGGGSKPAALQIAERMFALEKIRDNPNESLEARKAAAREYNLIGQAAKTYGFDRGIEYGLGGMGNIGMGGMEMPQQDVTRQVMSNQTQPGQFENLDAIMAEMGTPQTAPPSLPPVFQGMPQVSEVQGWSDIMAEREGKKAGAAERAKLEQQLSLEPEIKRQSARQQEVGKIEGQRANEFAEAYARIPQLQNMVSRLNQLGEAATYTLSGRARDTFMREMGMDVPDSAVARAEYISMVDNEILPLLRQTFGAQFTQKEGERLVATLGDPNASPKEKDARLKAFIRTKMEEVNTQARISGREQPFPQSDIDAFVSGIGSGQSQQPKAQNGATATNPQTGQRLIFIDGQWRPL